MRRTWRAWVVGSGLFLLGGCVTGGGDSEEGRGVGGALSSASSTTTSASASGPDADEYIEATAALMADDEDLPLDDEAATCFATALLDVVGVEALQEEGVSPDEFAEAESFSELGVEVPADAAGTLGQALGECDAAAQLAPALSEEFASGASGAGTELTPDDTACVEENLDGPAVANGLAEAFVDGSDAALQTAVIDAVAACPDVLTAVILAEAPGTVTPEAEACVATYLEDNPDAARGALTGDSAAAEDLGVQLAAACPEAFGG